jgi:hypothetical protein
MAAWIPRVQRISFFITSFATTFHVIQSSVRLLTSEDRPMLYGTWYPFDTTKSPVYELMNISEVRNSVSSEVIISVSFISWSRVKFPPEEDDMIHVVCTFGMFHYVTA